MNFLSHAIPYLDDPLVAICTGIPDWLGVIDRKIRVRERMAAAVLQSGGGTGDSPIDPELHRVATGILHHIRDDRWFHGTAAFVETNLQLAVSLRERLPGDEGFRPMFVAHIVIEIMLDALWIRDQPELARQYYGIFDTVSPETIQRHVNHISQKPTDRLAETIGRYVEARFLYDYLDPTRLLVRLNQVMNRVRLAPLPDSILPWLHEASELVESRRMQFLTQPDGTTRFPSLSQD